LKRDKGRGRKKGERKENEEKRREKRNLIRDKRKGWKGKREKNG